MFKGFDNLAFPQELCLVAAEDFPFLPKGAC
jgi:hypothetical protein